MERKLVLSNATSLNARTIMFAEIRDLLEAVPASDASSEDYQRAVLEENCLNKNTLSARKKSMMYLRRLYGLDFSDPVYRAFHTLWMRSETAQPLLALQRTWVSDLLVRDSVEYFLQLKVCDTITSQKTSAWVSVRYGTRYSKACVRSIGQNLNSCWHQAGFVEGISKRTRKNAIVLPENVAFAMYLGYLDGNDGAGLFETRMASLLDVSGVQLMTLAETAARQGLIKFKHIADVMEIGFDPFTGALS